MIFIFSCNKDKGSPEPQSSSKGNTYNLLINKKWIQTTFELLDSLETPVTEPGYLWEEDCEEPYYIEYKETTFKTVDNCNSSETNTGTFVVNDTIIYANYDGDRLNDTLYVVELTETTLKLQGMGYFESDPNKKIPARLSFILNKKL